MPEVPFYFRSLLVTWAAAMWIGGTLYAQAPDAAALARQLDSDAFGERHAATIRLRRMGETAHAALIEVAQHGSAEARTRALAILQNHWQSGDAALQEAAKAALEQLAQGNSQAARFAQSILTPPQPSATEWARLARARGVLIRGGAQLNVQLGARPQLPAAVRRYSLTVHENGRRIRVRGSEQGIQIEVSETQPNGRQVTHKYEAKSEAELKAKHPEAHGIFEQMRQRYGLRDPNPGP